MHQSTVLPHATARLRTETFDPTNLEHLRAFEMITQHGIQHPEIRFKLDHPYLNVPAMMHARIGKAYLDLMKLKA